jgi:hypothetical protein
MADKDKKPRRFLVVVAVSILEEEGAYGSTQKTWSQEQVAIPLDRITAFDAQEMVDRSIKMVVNVAGNDE